MRRKIIAIPRNGFLETFLQGKFRLPAKNGMRFGCTYISRMDIARRDRLHLGCEVTTLHEFLNHPDKLKNRQRMLKAYVEGLAMYFLIGKSLCHLHVTMADIFDVHVITQKITHKPAFATDDWSLIFKKTTNRVRNEATPIKISSAENISASQQSNRQTVRMMIRLSHEVCTTF